MYIVCTQKCVANNRFSAQVQLCTLNKSCRCCQCRISFPHLSLVFASTSEHVSSPAVLKSPSSVSSEFCRFNWQTLISRFSLGRNVWFGSGNMQLVISKGAQLSCCMTGTPDDYSAFQHHYFTCSVDSVLQCAWNTENVGFCGIL